MPNHAWAVDRILQCQTWSKLIGCRTAAFDQKDLRSENSFGFVMVVVLLGQRFNIASVCA